ncbi:hypothetical protein ACOSQ4_019877 [Xanthoceras sorbifolium]
MLIVRNATTKTAKVYGGALLVYSAAKILYFLIDEVKIQYVLDILAKFVKCLEKVTKAKRILQSFGVKDLFNPSSTIESEDFGDPSSTIGQRRSVSISLWHLWEKLYLGLKKYDPLL